MVDHLFNDFFTFNSSRTPDISNQMERVSIGPNGETPRNKSHGDGRGDSRANYTAQDSMSDHKTKGKPRSLRYVTFFFRQLISANFSIISK